MSKKDRFYLFGTEEGTKGPEFNVFENVGLGLASGALKIPEAILELGAGFIDYAADTDLVTALEENYPRINVTDGVGKFVEIAVQYGVPYSQALRIGSKLGSMKKMRDLGNATKVNTASKIAGKMGYYGAPAVVTDIAFGSARDATLGEAFGAYDEYEKEVEGKKGSEKAEEVLKQKILTGIEGGVLGGLISTAAGPAIKTTFKLGAMGASGVGKVVSPLVINPLQNLLAKPAVGSLTAKTLNYIDLAKQKIAPLSLRQLKMMDENKKTIYEKIRSKIAQYVTPEGLNPREVQARLGGVDDAVKAVRNDLDMFIPMLVTNIKKASQIISNGSNKTGKMTLTREQALLKEQTKKLIEEDVSKVLSLREKEGGLRIQSKDASKETFRTMYAKKGLKGKDLDNLVNSLTNVKDIGRRLVIDVNKTFKDAGVGAGLRKEITTELNENIEKLIYRDSTNYFAAFDNQINYRFKGKEFEVKKTAAIEDAYNSLKAEQLSLKTSSPNPAKYIETADEVLREKAKKEIEQLIRLAESQRSEGSFFFNLRVAKERGATEAGEKYYTSISKEMIDKRFFKEGDDYSLRLKELLGGEFSPLKGFEDKYMSVAKQLGLKKYVNSLVSHDTSLGAVVANRMQKIFFKPTKTAAEIMEEVPTISRSDAEATASLDLRRQVATEYGLDIDKVPQLVATNPKKFVGDKKVDEDIFGVFDAINTEKGNAYFTTTGIAENLKGMKNITDSFLSIPLYKSFLKMKAGTQIGKTILSPVTQIRNFTSAAFFALHNGHFGNPFGKGDFSISDVLKQHVDELFPNGVIDQAGLKKVAQEARRKTELGVTSGSPIQKEIDDLVQDLFVKRGSDYATTEELFNAAYSSTKYKNLRGTVKNITGYDAVGFSKRLYSTANQFYAKGDDFWKDYGYRYTMSQLNEALPDVNTLNPLTSKNYTQEEVAKLIEKAHNHLFKRRPNILKDGAERGKSFGVLGEKYKNRKELMEEFSAEYIKNTYPNYSYVSQAVRELRRLPIGNFISFPAEILRTSSNLAVLTGRELSIATGNAALDTAFRKMGSRRLLGQMAGFTSGPLLATYSLKMLGITDQQYEALRESQVAEWNKYSDLIMIGKRKDKDGNVKYKYLNFAYQNPYDYIRAPMYNFLGEYNATGKVGMDHEDRFVKSALQGLSTLFQPFMGEAILTERLLDVYRGTTNTGKRVWDKDVDNAGDIMVRSFTHLLKGVTPGVFSQVSNVSEAVAKNVTPYGKQYDLSDELIALLSGVRVYEADMKNNLNFSLNNHLRSIQTLKSRAGSQIFASNVTPNTVVSAYKDYVEGSYREYNEMRKILNDLEILGFERKYINKYFKQRKVRKDIVKTLRRDRFVPPKWETFYNDQRFEKIAKERGLSRRQLFPRRQTRDIERQYRSIDLLQSLDSVRSLIKNKEKDRDEKIAQRTATQGQGITADGSPLVTRGAQVAPNNQQMSAITGKTGLTEIETALLSPEEQIIRQRNRIV